MSYLLKFSNEGLKREIEDYKKVDITPEQKTMINENSRLLAEFLEVSDIAIKSIMWKACKEWQVKNNKKIAEIAIMNPDERLFAVKELFNICKQMLLELLMDRKKQEILVDVAFEKAYKLYLKRF